MPNRRAQVMSDEGDAKQTGLLDNEYRRRGIPVVMGGFHATLMTDEVKEYAEAVPEAERPDAVICTGDLTMRARSREFEAAGAPVDSYGCGDSFAAGFTYALATGSDPFLLAARCGALCALGRGPYGYELTLEDAERTLLSPDET